MINPTINIQYYLYYHYLVFILELSNYKIRENIEKINERGYPIYSL